MNLFVKCSVVAAALASGAVAQAALKSMATTDGSVAFLAIDPTAPTSLVVDLNYFITDVTNVYDATGNPVAATGALFSSPGQTIQWNFNTDTLTVNGVAQSGAFNWSTPYGLFQAAAAPTSTQWAVISGSSTTYPNTYLTTGNPTGAQLARQTADFTSSLSFGDNVFGFNNTAVAAQPGANTLGLPGAGANAAFATQAVTGYVGNGSVLGPNLNWQGNLSWSAAVPQGGAASLFRLSDDADGAIQIAGAFTYNAGVLTWSTAPVPEPSGVLLAVVGIAILLFAGQRRLAT